MKNILYILLILPTLLSCQSEKNVNKYPFFVGDIQFDEKLDDKDFKRCNSEKSFSYQYYNFDDFEYEGEKIEIIRQFEKLNISSEKNINGYITIRFLINCEGKSGIFRVQQMNSSYKEEILDKKFSENLLNFTKSLKGWKTQEEKEKKVDYYQYLTFKIRDGKVTEILP